MTKESAEARAERITRELRAATVEAAGVLKDLTTALAGARKMADQYAAHQVETVMNGYLKLCQSAVDQWNADMQADVARLQEMAAKRTQEIIDSLGELWNIEMTEKQEIPGIPDAVRTVTGRFVRKVD